MTTATVLLIHLDRPRWPGPQEAAARLNDHLTERDQHGPGLGLTGWHARPCLGAFDVIVELTHGPDTDTDRIATEIAKIQRIDGIRRTLTLPVLEDDR